MSDIEQVKLTRPKTYFDLIEKTGSKGKYQFNIFLIFAFNWFIGGFILLGTSFLFMNPKFGCADHNIKTNNCQQYVCNLNQDSWKKYLEPQQVNSLATQYGPFYCSNEIILIALRMLPYIGTFCGYMFFLYFTDNYGRKMSIVLAWSVTTFGIGLVCISFNITVAGIGLFLAGAGCESAIRISMSVFGEIVDYYKRQKYSVGIQIFFGLSGVIIGFVYWLIKQWRIILIVFVLIPAIIQLLLLIFYLEQTPKFLIRKGKQHALKSLNRIGLINTGVSNLITQQDIDNVLEEEGDDDDTFKNIKVTPFDLFGYKSLRSTTILCSLLFFFISFIYFGPFIIVDRLGINPFVSQVILSMAQVLAYPTAFFVISRMKRVFSGKISFGLSAIFTGVLIFVKEPQLCHWCSEGIIQLILIFCSRFIISFYFAIFFLFVTELYPSRVRGLGFGMTSAFGAIGSASGQFILQLLQLKGISPMILFTIFALLSIVCLHFLEQTHNKPLKEQIEQIQKMKNDSKAHKKQLQSRQSHNQQHQMPQMKNSAP